jgi:vacuolar iron transporter family protein
VLGANDGLLSTSSILIGVAAASASRPVLLATGVAAVVAGASSMAIGEYSSVSSQRDAEEADLAVEAEELETVPGAELAELAAIYRKRGLPPELARQVAEAFTEHDALAAHARDELGIDPHDLARPLQAAVVSAASFTAGALLPVLMVLAVGASARVAAVMGSALVGLAALGAIGARLGGAPPLRPALRVLIGGAAAMALAFAVGQAFDVTVA